MARSKRKPRTQQMLVPPTPERIAKAEGFIHASKDGRVIVNDSPFERLHSRGKITQQQYDAGVKFRHHWHRAGLEPHFASVNFDGTGGGEGWNLMPESEVVSHHRKVYRDAVQDLGPVQSLVVEDVVCREVEPLTVGRKLRGHADDRMARAAGEAMLFAALDRLHRFFF